MNELSIDLMTSIVKARTLAERLLELDDDELELQFPDVLLVDLRIYLSNFIESTDEYKNMLFPDN